MNIGQIISYREMCNEENVQTLQRGMNYRTNRSYSIFLMSRTSNAPYNDEVEENGEILIYEGHDIPRNRVDGDPKLFDQPMLNKNKSLTPNGLFYTAANEFKIGHRNAEIVRVYEKIKSGIWVHNGYFELIDSWLEKSNGRHIFKFKLKIVGSQIEKKATEDYDLPHNRLIPSSIKIKVWKRDKGMCVNCRSTTNLHYDHVIPFSKGGTSLSASNIQLLCMSCNLSKSDKIV